MRHALPALLLPLLLVLPGCATTTFNSTWHDPTAEPVKLDGRRVAAVVMTRNPANRKSAEDTLAREITKRGGIGIASYTLLSSENPADPDQAQKELAAKGIDGIVSMRVISRENQETYVPGHWTSVQNYRSWNSYWGYGWRQVYEPGYLQTDTIVSVETLVYSFRQDKLLWAGMSETINPSKASALVEELAGRVAGELKKDGLLTR